MELNEEVIDTSLDIINMLLEGEDISKSKNYDLYQKYINNTEIENMTDKIAAKMGFEIYRFDSALSICVMLNNKVFGFTNEDLKNKIKQLNKNEDIYLMYFIILTLITLFYKESGLDTARSYLGMDELLETINVKFENLVNEELEQISKEQEYNFLDIKKVWERLADAKEEITGISKNNKISFVKIVLKFLTDEKLLSFDESRGIISITNRFKAIIYFYFEYSKENKNKLLDYIYGLGGEYATY